MWQTVPLLSYQTPELFNTQVDDQELQAGAVAVLLLTEPREDAGDRLDLEQELACDEEVLALGSRASHYACHLLGIARCAVRTPALAVSGLEMARRSHLEERIMTMLRRPHHRKAKLMVLLPAAALVGAMVPALAAVHPGDSPPRQASPELEQIITEMEEVEARLEPHLEEIEAAIEVELEPSLEKIEEIEVEIDHQAFAEIEEKMRPHLERIEEIEIDMEPMLAQIEVLERELENIQIHVEDGTLEGYRVIDIDIIYLDGGQGAGMLPGSTFMMVDSTAWPPHPAHHFTGPPSLKSSFVATCTGSKLLIMAI